MRLPLATSLATSLALSLSLPLSLFIRGGDGNVGDSSGCEY
jgi:hypothetical protein